MRKSYLLIAGQPILKSFETLLIGACRYDASQHVACVQAQIEPSMLARWPWILLLAQDVRPKISSFSRTKMVRGVQSQLYDEVEE